MMILISSIWTYSNVETSGRITLEVFTALITKNNHDRLFFVISAVRMYMKKELFASTALQITEIHTILNRYHYFSKTPLKVYFLIGRVKPIKT